MMNKKDKVLEVLYKNTLKQEKLIVKAIERSTLLSDEQKKLYKSSLPLFRKLYPKEALNTYYHRFMRSKAKENRSKELDKFDDVKFNYFNEILNNDDKIKFNMNFNEIFDKSRKIFNRSKFTDFRDAMIRFSKDENHLSGDELSKQLIQPSDNKSVFEYYFALRDLSLEQFKDLSTNPEEDATYGHKILSNNKEMKSRNTLISPINQKKFNIKTTDDNKLALEFILNQHNLISRLWYEKNSLTLLKNENYKNVIFLANKISKELAKHSDKKVIDLLVCNFEKGLKKVGININDKSSEIAKYIVIDKEKLANYGKVNHVEETKKQLHDSDFIKNYEAKKTNPKAAILFDSIYDQMQSFAIKEILDYENDNSGSINRYETKKHMTETECRLSYSKDIQDFPKTAFHLFINNIEDNCYHPVLKASSTNIPKKYRLMINEFAEENPDINLAKEFSNYEFELNPNPKTSNYLIKMQEAKHFKDMDGLSISKKSTKPNLFLKGLTSDIESLTSDNKNKIYYKRILSHINTEEFEPEIRTLNQISWKLAFDAYNIFQEGKKDFRYFSKSDNSKKLSTAIRKIELATAIVEDKNLSKQEKKEIYGTNLNLRRILNKAYPEAVQTKMAFNEQQSAIR